MRKTLISLVTTLSIGCGSPERNTSVVLSPRYQIVVHENGYSPDLNMIDSLYERTLDCLEYPPDDRLDLAHTFFVTIATDMYGFDCTNMNGKCAGEYFFENGRVRLTESLIGFAHELTHHFTRTRDHNPPFRYDCANIGTDIDSEIDNGVGDLVHESKGGRL